ncbi:Holliday junction branch migration protein RuvA [Marispirochaeta sp.]|jgi:holliday junction DNA helicase RuvA|uniref:Holliday junction branch migration protein RuvA n=1 Tax=Marispirochaeta sp. TaxID=2038653 RepID=UPI0029C662D7|nr:Holliday junction branch migration protein RuvA [Marispirochaeta sp.]
MYNSLTGTVTEASVSECCLDVGGVEYILTVTSGALQQLHTGQRHRIIVYLYHKEDLMKLYGFADEMERSVFFKLLKVSGVGPSLAIKILSGLPSRRLASAIEDGDIASLSSIPGLGKKTAQKIILALQGTIVSMEGEGAGPHGDLISALAEMGFDRSAAAEAVRSLCSKLPDNISETEAEERLMRDAIVLLSRGAGG